MGRALGRGESGNMLHGVGRDQWISNRSPWIGCACILLLVLGCGPRDKVKVSGTVTWKGQPVPVGYISFFSGPQVPAGAGRIEAGRFAFFSKPGNLSVQITAAHEGKFDPKARTVLREQYIPAKYNRNTTLTANVTLDGANNFTFDLTDDPKDSVSPPRR